ncbi:MAG: stage II sporulation protein D [Flavobacteriales bacterium]|jgi:stage II sporulation protein D
MRVLLIILFLFQASLLEAKQLIIGLYENVDVQKVLLAAKHGIYELKHQNNVLIRLDESSEAKIIYLSFINNQIKVLYNGENVGLFRDLIFSPKNINQSFKIKVEEDERQYTGDLDIRLLGGKIKLLNKVDLEEYVAGVVESEIGHSQNLEFLKAQAILVRTYGLRNVSKHMNFGYQLCDTEHCQVFGSRAYSKNEYLVRQATHATQSIVALDKNKRLIEAVFHSNCGGQTLSSLDLWGGKDISYLKSSTESICLDAEHGKWFDKISKKDWYNFLERMNPTLKGNYALYLELNQFEQEQRLVNFECGDRQIPVTKIREVFDLPSTFFSYKIIGEDVIIKGRGFGHGVGMCQEGAEKRAISGYSYKEILRHYFKGIQLENYQS